MNDGASLTVPKLLKPPKPAYKPIESTLRHGAYAAAHKIVMSDFSAHGLVCPGAIRSWQVDQLAAIIEGSMLKVKR